MYIIYTGSSYLNFDEILKKCFLVTTCIVIAIGCSEIQSHNSVLPVSMVNFTYFFRFLKDEMKKYVTVHVMPLKHFPEILKRTLL